jgi:hypothetical protein
MGLITGPLRRRAGRHLEGEEAVWKEDANSLGVESAGKWQVRGNGTLALTEGELLFAQWVPNRLVRISRSSISEVTTARSHLGKWIGRELLKVVWTNEVGEEDSIALWVPDLEGWLEALDRKRPDQS